MQDEEKGLNERLKMFWEIEELPTEEKIWSKEEKLAEEHYQRTVKVHTDGRFILKLSFNEENTH